MKHGNQRWSLDRGSSDNDHNNNSWLVFVATAAATTATVVVYYYCCNHWNMNHKDQKHQSPINSNNQNNHHQNSQALRLDRDDKSLDTETTEPPTAPVVHQDNPSTCSLAVHENQNVLIINADDHCGNDSSEGKVDDDHKGENVDSASLVLATMVEDHEPILPQDLSAMPKPNQAPNAITDDELNDAVAPPKDSSSELVVATIDEEPEDNDAASQDTIVPLKLVDEEQESRSSNSSSSSFLNQHRQDLHASTITKDGSLPVVKKSPVILPPQLDTDQETEDDESSLATVNWILSPLRFTSTKTMKQRVKNLGKKLHKISTKRRLLQGKHTTGRTALPLSSPDDQRPISNFCPESTA